MVPLALPLVPPWYPEETVVPLLRRKVGRHSWLSELSRQNRGRRSAASARKRRNRVVAGDHKAPLRPKHVILVVEDTRPIADLICQTLNEEPQYEAIAVENGAAALETLQGVRASLLILDVSLPGISGLELYDRLQGDAAMKDIPALFVTADSEAIRSLDRERMPNVLAKPFDLDDLLHLVAHMLAGAA
jgi:CheY-like chemotaxis protein